MRARIIENMFSFLCQFFYNRIFVLQTQLVSFEEREFTLSVLLDKPHACSQVGPAGQQKK